MNRSIDKYIQKQNLDLVKEIFNFSGCPGLFIIIPCYDEPDLFDTLESIAMCESPGLPCAVLLIFNSGINTPEEIIERNREIYIQLKNKIGTLNNSFCSFYAINIENIPEKYAGVGYARKVGMDLALRFWSKKSFPNGILCSLDADAVVEKNYLFEVTRYFQHHIKSVACTFNFAHNLNIKDPKQKEGVILYELYMRYYKNALNYVGFIPAVYTIGSCFAVRAVAYAKAGGMNRRKAGEDFYFIQKLAPLGKIGEVNQTTVHLSGRFSDRVPFGTGPLIKKWVKGQADLTLTYPFYLFEDVKKFYSDIEKHHQSFNPERYNKVTIDYFMEVNVNAQIEELRKNCSSLHTFRERFYHIFNAFFILKWLNFCLNNGVDRNGLVESVIELLREYGVVNVESRQPLDLLLKMRSFELKNGNMK